MSRKHALIYGVVLFLLAGLFYVQFRTWRNFDWSTFLGQTRNVSTARIGLAVLFIYCAYFMRAVRWAVFLKPVRPSSAARLLTPTVVGFTALALLGRAGEMIRPYLIAKKESLPFSSQLAVWAVERIFDLGAFAALLCTSLLASSGSRHLLRFYKVGGPAVFVILAAAAGCGLIAIWRGDRIIRAIIGQSNSSAARFAGIVAFRIVEFRSGLNAIQDFSSFVKASAVSLAMWLLIQLSYMEVLHAYSDPSLQLSLTQVPLLMLSSMVGSIVALPGVGGGSQLATIFTLQRLFDAPRELAASCGILLWLVTFAAIIPAGLVLAHKDRMSLRALSAETQLAEDEDVPPEMPRV